MNIASPLDLSHLPHPSERNIAIHVKPAAERALRNGHPWVYDESIREQSKDGNPGDLAVIFDKKRRFLAIGLYDPDSPIRVKILQHSKHATIDQLFFHDKLARAAEIRASLVEQNTIGYRLVHGENDSLPGLVIDRYANTLVIKLYSAAWFAHLRDVLSALEEVHPAQRIVLRLSRALQQSETFGLFDGQIIKGDSVSQPIIFTENDLYFAADVLRGNKTGFFFDQRENRARVRQLASDKHVLDIFSYNGGFSVYAASGGAKSVLSLDISKPALASAQGNMALNSQLVPVANCQHNIMLADAFEGLQSLKKSGRKFELVIVDPPSFAKRQTEVEAALSSYARLTKLALNVLQPGGTLVAASCSSRVSQEQFFTTVHNSAIRASRPLQEIERTTHAIDHPLLDSFPEGAYLKCLFATAP